MWVRFLLLLLRNFKNKNKRFFHSKNFFFNGLSSLEKINDVSYCFFFIKNVSFFNTDFNINFFSSLKNLTFVKKNTSDFFIFYYKFLNKGYFFDNNKFFFKFSYFFLLKINHLLSFYKFFYINNFFHLSFYFKNLENLLNDGSHTFIFYRNDDISKLLKKINFSYPKPSYRNLDTFEYGGFFKNPHTQKYRGYGKRVLDTKSLRTSPKFFFFIFYISKITFNSSMFNKSYFKKFKTLAFQLNKNQHARDLIFLTRTSPRFDNFEYSFFKNSFLNNYLNKFFKHVYLFNFYNFFENIFFKQYRINSRQVNSCFDQNTNIFFFLLKSRSHFLNVLVHAHYLHSSWISFNVGHESVFSPNNNFSSSPQPSFKILSFNEPTAISANFVLLQNYSFNDLNFFFFSTMSFFKFFIKNLKKNSKSLNFLYFSLKIFYKKFLFYSKFDFFFKSNLAPSAVFNFYLKKKIFKFFTYDKFPQLLSPLYTNSLVRFFEYCSGKKIAIKINTFVNGALSYYEKLQCLNWATRIKIFRKMLGPRLFLAESLEIIYLSFKLRDPFLLSHWLVNMMKKVSFWKYRLFFRYLRYVLRFFFAPIFKDIEIKGIKFRLKGKISVAGNSRTRTILQRTGSTGHSTFDNKILHHLSLVRSFTGVMGLKVWILF